MIFILTSAVPPSFDFYFNERINLQNELNQWFLDHAFDDLWSTWYLELEGFYFVETVSVGYQWMQYCRGLAIKQALEREYFL